MHCLARIIFLGICIVLAFLLLIHVITIMISGIIFAISLIVFGLLSRSAPKRDK
jgi:hypothetical protein